MATYAKLAASLEAGDLVRFKNQDHVGEVLATKPFLFGILVAVTLHHLHDGSIGTHFLHSMSQHRLYRLIAGTGQRAV